MHLRLRVAALAALASSAVGTCPASARPVFLAPSARFVGAARSATSTSRVAEPVLSGRIRDTRGEPIVGVTVEVAGTTRGTVTGADGRYRLALPEGADEVTVSVRAIGYRTETRALSPRGLATLTLDLTLRDEDVAGEEITVTSTADQAAQRASQSTGTLGERDLAAVRGATLGEALERLPGVTTLTTGPTIAKPVVRGLHSERVVLVNAGLVQEGQQWGGEHAPEIDPFAPARVEVLRGVAGVEAGVGAIGGVVRLVPRPLPDVAGVTGLVQTNGFSNNRQGAGSLLVEGATAEGAVAGGGLGWRVQGSLRRAGDSRAPGYVLANTGAFERAGQLALGWHRGAWGLDALASRYQTTLGVYRGAHVATAAALRRLLDGAAAPVTGPFSYHIGAPRQEIVHDIATATLHRDGRAGDRLSVQYGVQRNHRQEYDLHNRFQTTPEGTLAFDLALVTQTLDARYRHRPARIAGMPTVGTVGLSAMGQANRNGAAGQLVPNFSAWTGGAWAREQAVTHVAGRALRLDIGGRADARVLTAYPRNIAAGAYERRTTRYAALSGAFGAVYDLAPRLSVAANIGTAWRPPSVNELYANGVHHGTATYEIGDPSLGRETSLGMDATLRYAGRRLSGEASVFRTAFGGFLYQPPDTAIVTTIRGAFPRRAFEQTDARLWGLDGGARLALTHPGGGAERGLALDVTAALVRGDDTARDEPLAGMPADRVTLGLTYAPRPTGRLSDASVGARLRLVDRQRRVPSLPDFAPPPAAYRLVDIEASGTVRMGGSPVVVSLSIHNVFDTAYRDYLSRFRFFADEAGRTVVLRLAVPIGGYRM